MALPVQPARPVRLRFGAGAGPGRNGFFYVLDRASGEFLLGKPFIRQTWASGLDDQGHPVHVPGVRPSAEGTKVYPGVLGGTNWYSPSFSPRTALFYVPAWLEYSSTFI